MVNKNDFTPEEWTKVLDSILAAGLAVSAADPSGWWGTLKEAAAGTPALVEAESDPNSNELIKAAIVDFVRSDEGSILAMRERFARLESAEGVQRSLTSLREASAIVDAKAPMIQPPSKPGCERSADRSPKLPSKGRYLALAAYE